MSRNEERPGVTSDDPPARAAGRVLAFHARHLATHATALREGSRDPEHVHDMRVATRRLRTALAVFARWLPGKASRRLSRRLRGFTRRLGAVRDLDVLLASLEGGPRGVLADAFRKDLERQRDHARQRLDRALEGGRLESLLAASDRFGAALDTGADPAPGRLGPEVPVLVFEALAQARAAGPGPSPTPEDLHALRVGLKRLRYTVEAVSEVLGEAGEAFLAALREQQDVLGALQDARVAAERVEAWLAASGATPRAARPLAAWLKRRRDEADAAVAAAPARWAAFEGSGLRQRLAAACAEL